MRTSELPPQEGSHVKMSGRPSIGRWTLGWLLVFPVVFIGLIPWRLRVRFEGALAWQGTPWQWIGLWCMLNGLGLVAWCVTLFISEGQGTPLPTHPPQRFVVTGPYQFVRNPMALGFFLMLAGESAVYQSKVVVGYLIFIMTVINLFVRVVEEPDLERRFGSCYVAYKRQVARWVPRLPSGVSTKPHQP